MEEKDFQAEWIPHPLILYQSAVPAACSILQCKYSNMVKYNGPNDDDGTENCISYSKIVVNKYKYQHSRDTSIYKYQYIRYYTADAKMLSVNLIFCSIMNTYLAFVQYINKDFPPLTFEIANHKCTFFSCIDSKFVKYLDNLLVFKRQILIF